MSQLSFSSFDSSLMVRDAQGRYLLASAEQILEAARQAIERKMQRDTSFTSPAAVKEYLRAKLAGRSEEHTSELQSLMRISYAVFCLKKKKIQLSYEESYDT